MTSSKSTLLCYSSFLALQRRRRALPDSLQQLLSEAATLMDKHLCDAPELASHRLRVSNSMLASARGEPVPCAHLIIRVTMCSEKFPAAGMPRTQTASHRAPPADESLSTTICYSRKSNSHSQHYIGHGSWLVQIHPGPSI